MPKLEISEDIIKQTTKCHSNFSCLDDEENPKCPVELALCPVENHIDDSMVFVDFNKDPSCDYSMPYGTDHRICHCPVRNEIYKRYSM
jgi:hypothetical protein